MSRAIDETHDPALQSCVVVTFTTHDVGGLSQRDIDLARCADAAYERFANQERSLLPCAH